MDSMRERIAFLYPKQTDEIFQKLRQIIDDFRHTSEVKKHFAFSEKDVVLICYPNHVFEQHNHLDHGRDQVGTLKILHRFLEKYAKGLVNKIHLLPFYPYSSDDGFSVIDYYAVREELGDWGDVKGLSKDFSLMFDLVINHVSAKSLWFQKFLAGDPKYKDYFITFDNKVDTLSVYRPRTHPLLTLFRVVTGPAAVKTAAIPDGPISKTSAVKSLTKYLWTTFSEDQIDLNYKNPVVLLEMIKILLFYISKGASVIRLDAVRYLWKDLGTSCVDLPQTHTIIKLLKQIIEEVAPYVRLITEINGPHQINTSYFGNGLDEADLVYNFSLPPLILYSLVKGDVSQLTKWAQGLKTPFDSTTFFNFTASHDGIGLMPLKNLLPKQEIDDLVNYTLKNNGRINYRNLPDGGKEPYELNITYLSALGSLNKFIASQVIMLSLQGVPAIYFNSLFGVENWQEGVKKLGYNRAINRQKFNYQELVNELKDKQSIKHQVYTAYQKLLQIRINEPLFSPSAGQEIIDLHPKIFAVVRFNPSTSLRASSQNKLLCLVNVSNDTIEIEANKFKSLLGKNQVKDLITGEETNLNNSNLLRLNPYQILWIR